MNKETEILKAVDALKNSEFKATAIKVELEAQLGRRTQRTNTCDECDEGSVTCGECDGAYRWDCGNCQGSGTDEDIEGDTIDCADCDGTGNQYCDYCDEGYRTCNDCDGNWQGDAVEEESNYGETINCHIFIMKELNRLGLTEYRADEQITLAHGIRTKWHPIAPLKYAEFYNDGSVDSEFTFTLSLEDNRSVLILPKVIEVFKKLADEVGNGLTVTGAGMHMALINDPQCLYPTNNYQELPYIHFRRGMTMLLPALYFLGTSSNVTRGLGYRRPGIDAGSHRTAIDYRGGAVEFRVFDTCYDTPEAILDNVVVMKNAMKYWSRKPQLPKIAEKYPRVRFGRDCRAIHELYSTFEHLDLLEAGLKALKPSYYTVTELKKQRDFKVDRRYVANIEGAKAQEIADTYKEYDDRFTVNTLVQRQYHIAHHLDQLSSRLITDPQADYSVCYDEAVERAKEWEEKEKARKLPVDKYVQDKLAMFMESLAGEYRLEVGGM